jgi:ketosteroid isomerase-like protein
VALAEGLRRGIEAWFEPWVGFRFEPREVLERGDEVLAIVRYRGRGRSSGLEIDDRVAHLWEFRGGRVVRLRMFGDVEKARRRFVEGGRKRTYKLYDLDTLEP